MDRITVSDYLVQELHKLGITDFFGLPGDYSFNIITSIENNPDTNWVGSTNELNAGYSADGYARIKGFGALVTTYNVGELSAINAVAGSFAENVAVISIVGMPATRYIKNNSLIHHNFQNPNYFAAFDAYSNMVQATAILYENNAKEEIDRVLSVFVKERKPVYIGIPSDVCEIFIKNESILETPQSNYKKLEKAVNHALKLINSSTSPIIIGDSLVERFQAREEFQNFVKNSGFPSTTLIMGKGLIYESSPNFIGTYLGSIDNIDVYDYVNKSDCIISIGTIYSDLNAFKCDINFKPSDFIEVHGTYVVVEKNIYEDVLMKDFLNELANQVEFKNIEIKKDLQDRAFPEIIEEKILDFDYFTPRFEKFLKEDDLIFVDTGILDYVVPSIKIPDGCVLYEQVLWGSIGWATPAVFGAGLADKNKRIILLTGEGSIQLTIQSVSSMIYRGLKPIIFVLNNSGYTIERILSKNPESDYNNIVPWDYVRLFEAFDAEAYTAKVKTNIQLDNVLNTVGNLNHICFIELFTDKMNIPKLLRKYKEMYRK